MSERKSVTRARLAQLLDDHLPRMALHQYGQGYNADPDFDIKAYYDRVASAIFDALPATPEGVFRTDDEMEVAQELQRATDKFGPMASPHEALAVIEEEFMEFREAVFWRRSDPRTEAVQLAAMVLRYLHDCKPERSGE